MDRYIVRLNKLSQQLAGLKVEVQMLKDELDHAEKILYRISESDNLEEIHKLADDLYQKI